MGLDHRNTNLARTRDELHQFRERLEDLQPRDCAPTDICSAVTQATQ